MNRRLLRIVSTTVPASFVLLLATVGACGGSEGDGEGEDPVAVRDGGRRRDAAAATSSSGEKSSSSGGSSSGGSSSSSSGGSSSSSGATCSDPDDASDMLSPQQLGPRKDSDNGPFSVTGIMDGMDDEDAYQWAVSDGSGSFLIPVVSSVATNVQLCTFLKCGAGTLQINECKRGSVALSYSDTVKGCCGQSIEIDYDCATVATDDVQMFVRVRSTAPQCEAYSFEYSQ